MLDLFASERDTLTRASLLSLLGTVAVRKDITAVDLLKTSPPSILCKFGVYLEEVEVGRENFTLYSIEKQISYNDSLA